MSKQTVSWEELRRRERDPVLTDGDHADGLFTTCTSWAHSLVLEVDR
ncbi:hypothetical protein [Nocardia sp. A7]